MIRNIDECIQLIMRIQELQEINDQDINELIGITGPFLTKRYGKGLNDQIEKLIKAGNFDRAVKLLKALPKRGIGFMMKGKLMAVLIGLSVLAGAIVSIIAGSQSEQAEEVSNTEDWFTTEGVITTSRVGSQMNNEGSCQEDFPIIEFRYEVNGESYRSDSMVFSGFETAADVIDEVKEGDKIKVHYSQSDPSKAYITVQADSVIYMVLISLVFSAVFVFYFFRKKKRIN